MKSSRGLVKVCKSPEHCFLRQSGCSERKNIYVTGWAVTVGYNSFNSRAAWGDVRREQLSVFVCVTCVNSRFNKWGASLCAALQPEGLWPMPVSIFRLSMWECQCLQPVVLEARVVKKRNPSNCNNEILLQTFSHKLMQVRMLVHAKV